MVRDNPTKEVSNHMGTDKRSIARENRTICLPFPQENYEILILNPAKFREFVDYHIAEHPELFPPEIIYGYQMKDIKWSRKLKIHTRRIKIGNIAHTIRPSFAMPYMTAFTDDIENALFLRKFNVPFWALSRVFKKDPMRLHRMEPELGRPRLVGATIRKPDDLPEHLSADEKHTKLRGEKVYAATTVGNGCILGVSVAKNAGENELTDAYQTYKTEARFLNPEYSPKTVNTDGWIATQKAWLKLFPGIAVICCFLHVFIKIRDRAKKKYKELFDLAANRLWECYRAESKRSFSQRTRRLLEWCESENAPAAIRSPVQKLCKNRKDYLVAYDYPDAHRTSNMIDRLMQRMDRHLFSTQYFHGSIRAAELGIRGWALIQNFAPSNPQTVKEHGKMESPAHRLNKFSYHENWLHNMMISASLGGYRRPPLNPI
jgi:hypothetical protein